MMRGFDRKQWLKVVGAIVVGISVGIAGAALNVSHRSPQVAVTATSVPYIVPVSATMTHSMSESLEQPANSGTPAFAEQIERLKTRNRRLEALVSVLRQRAAEHK